MAVCKMQRMNIFAMQEDRDAILQRLQLWGMMEIDISLQNEALTTVDAAAQRQTSERNVQLLQQALDVLGRYAAEKKSLFASLEGKPLIEKDAQRDAEARSDDILDHAQTILKLEKEIAEYHAAIAKLENQIISLMPWTALDVPMGWEGTRETRLLLGTLPGIWTQTSALEAFAAAAPNVPLPDLTFLGQGKDYAYIALICHREDAQQTEEAMRSIGFARPSQTTKEPPHAEQNRLSNEIAQKQEHIAALEDQLSAYGPMRRDFEILADSFRMNADQCEVLGKLPQSKQAFFISGYVPAAVSERLSKDLTKRGAVVEIEEIPEEEEAPVMLKNNSVGAMAESIVKSFGVPGKGEVDPSFLTACFYVFFFGLMLSDAAYGLMLALGCGFALLKFPRMNPGMKKSLQLFFWGGISTLFWGLMFGGYFGDAVNVISRVFFGNEITPPALWFAPLNNPTRLLVFSMLFGLIHLFTGLGVKGYMCLRRKDIVGFIFDVLCWYFLLIGLIVILLPTDLFYGISQMAFNFPAAVVTGGKILAIVGALGLVLMAARSNKNPVLRIALGAYELYNITGWLSDVLSYSRLLALGLATGVIAQVVNQMGSMFGNSVFGIILFVIVFIFGHILNFAINLLGAYVHTCRLQYVEFYGKFYESGGREFIPFKRNTTYVDIKEEI